MKLTSILPLISTLLLALAVSLRAESLRMTRVPSAFLTHTAHHTAANSFPALATPVPRPRRFTSDGAVNTAEGATLAKRVTYTKKQETIIIAVCTLCVSGAVAFMVAQWKLDRNDEKTDASPIHPPEIAVMLESHLGMGWGVATGVVYGAAKVYRGFFGTSPIFQAHRQMNLALLGKAIFTPITSDPCAQRSG